MLQQQKQQNPSGYLEIFVGPMFSGKTSKLLDLYKKYTFCNIPICVINYIDDKRYHDSMLSSHDNTMIPCIQTKLLSSIWNYNDLDSPLSENGTAHLEIRTADIILINEAQFFPDLYGCVVDMLKEKKHVYLCGLDGDFQRNKFGSIFELIPLCDKMTKLTALCSLCKNGIPGIFSLRLSKEKEQMVIGASNYIPVCRNCYEENVNRI